MFLAIGTKFVRLIFYLEKCIPNNNLLNIVVKNDIITSLVTKEKGYDFMKTKKTFPAFVLALILIVLSGCSSSQEYIENNKKQTTDTSSRDDRVTIYTYVDPEDDSQYLNDDTMFYYPILQMAHMYNNYCSMNGVGDRAVEVIKFPTRDRMIQQMSTEIMAGGGPDIILLDNELPISKLIKQGAFVDLNTFIENDKSDNKLNLNNYNKTLMDTGLYNGKRYIMPMLYRPDILISNTAVMEHYNIKNDQKLTYDKLSSVFGDFISNNSKESFFEGYESSKNLLLKYIGDNINKENSTTNFDTKEFKQTVADIKKLITVNMQEENTIHSIEDNTCLFEKGYFDDKGRYNPINYCLTEQTYKFSIYDLVDGKTIEKYAHEFYSQIDHESVDSQKGWEEINRQFEDFVMERERENYNQNFALSGETTFINGINSDEDIKSGQITCGFMINGNSSKELQENAYDFMKYSLGERMQRYITYDSQYSTLSDSNVPNIFNMPVNNEALKTSYTDMGVEEKDVLNANADSPYLNKYIKHCLELNSFVINDGYYNKNVIGDLVEDFLQDNISLDNFITNLTSKTEIYLYE